MKLEKGEISSLQLMLLIISFVQGAHLTIAFTTGITKHDTWLAVITGIGISLLFVLIYITLAQKFPGKNLVQINDIIYGPYLGKIISALYICFFLLIASFNLRFVGTFLITYIMQETPISVFLIMFAFVCAWAVRNGIEVIARCSFIFIIITVIAVLSVTILSLKDVKLTNFLPVFEISLKDFIQGTHIVTSIPFCEIVVFLMVISYTNNIKQAKSSILLGLILGGIQLLIVAARDTAVLGILETVFVSPAFEVVKLIDIAKILTRLDILIAVVLLVTIFIKVCVFYYATVLGTAQSLHLRSYSPLMLPIGIIIISLAVMVFDSSAEHAYSAANIWPFVTIPFEFLIPPLSLIIAKIRGLSKKQGGECK